MEKSAQSIDFRFRFLRSDVQEAVKNKDPGQVLHMTRFVLALIAIASFLFTTIAPVVLAEANYLQEQPGETNQDTVRVGHLVQVPLPITSRVASQVRQTIGRLLEKAPAAVVRPADRMVVVLEFDTSGGKTGRGSEFGSCLDLARYLSGPELSRLQTVAYIPGPHGYVDPNADSELKSQLNGHAVLVAIAANELVMHENAAIGLASIDEQTGDQTIEGSYRAIANRRLTLPEQVVMSMVNSDTERFRVSTNAGIVYADSADLSELEAAGEVIETNTISKANELAQFSSKQLLDYRLIRSTVTSKNDLARQLKLAPNSLDGDPTLGREWNAVQIPMPEYVNDETAQWVIRALESRDPNLIIFRLDGRDSDPDACLRLAQHLAQYDSSQIRTVAYVATELRGPAALIALTCDHLIMAPEAELLGLGDTELDENTVGDFRSLIRELAKVKGRDWSLLMSSLDTKLAVNRYRNKETGQVRLLSSEEHEGLEASENWLMLGPLPIDGVPAEMAEQLFVARTIAVDMDAVQAFYQLRESPVTLQPTFADKWLKKVAGTLGSPLIAPWLLFGAVFFLSTEMSAPGLGVPGFLGTLCLILFFWSQYLGGNAHWLEILLFLTGVVFILIELFAIPGFGIFGIGGLIMVVVSIVLASQTFIIPTNNEQLARLPYSLLPVIGAGMGFLVALVVLRNVLPSTPYMRKMMLQPKIRNALAKEVEFDSEALVDWQFLLGRKGETVTRLFPSGKARIAGKVYDVISDGRMVDKGVDVEVVEVSGNRILIQLVDDA